MKQLHKIKNFLWKNKIYVLLTCTAIGLTTRALVINNSNSLAQKEQEIEISDYVLNGVPKESVYPSIDENGYFSKQEFYNAYIKNFQNLNNIPNSTRSYRFDFYGQSPNFHAVKATATVTYVLNGNSKTQSITENFSIIKNN